jgi:hypothetical protein
MFLFKKEKGDNRLIMATTRKTSGTKIDAESIMKRLEELEQENAMLRNSPENVAIRLDEYIEIMSLFPGKLNLSTEKLGRGRSFSFSRFGEVKRILYNDLASILENYHSFMEQGYFYILSERVIRKHGLDDTYEKLLNKEMMLKVISCDPKNAVKLYENATPAQKEVINGMIVSELKTGAETMDLNIVAKISKIADKDLIKLAEEAKQLEGVTA